MPRSWGPRSMAITVVSTAFAAFAAGFLASEAGFAGKRDAEAGSSTDVSLVGMSGQAGGCLPQSSLGTTPSLSLASSSSARQPSDIDLDYVRTRSSDINNRLARLEASASRAEARCDTLATTADRIEKKVEPVPRQLTGLAEAVEKLHKELGSLAVELETHVACAPGPTCIGGRERLGAFMARSLGATQEHAARSRQLLDGTGPDSPFRRLTQSVNEATDEMRKIREGALRQLANVTQRVDDQLLRQAARAARLVPTPTAELLGSQQIRVRIQRSDEVRSCESFALVLLPSSAASPARGQPMPGVLVRGMSGVQGNGDFCQALLSRSAVSSLAPPFPFESGGRLQVFAFAAPANHLNASPPQAAEVTIRPAGP